MNLAQKTSQANVEGFPIEDEWYPYYRQGKKPSVVAKVFADYMLSEGRELSISSLPASWKR